MKKDVIVIGGGVVGLMTAYSLVKAKRKVTVIDEGDITNSTSFGNAGLLSAFDKGSLSYPGVITNTLKQMVKGESPVKLHPTIDTKIYKWLLKFALSANETRFKRTIMLFEKYGHIANDMYRFMQKEEGLDLDFHEKGMLSVFTEEKTYQEKLKKYNFVDEDRFTILDKTQIEDYLPCGDSDKIKGAILFKKNTHFDPKKAMFEMKKYLVENGVEFILNEKIDYIRCEENEVKYISSDKKNIYEANTYIMSTGYQTLLAKQAKKDLMMTPAKGYSITFSMPNELKPKTSTLFNDLFIVMTPRKNTVRLTSKLEIGSNNPKIVKEQIDSIKENFSRYNKSFEMNDIVEWTGFRPLTPNDMPLIGRDEKYKNLVYGMGLGWLGMTFAPAIGSILTDLVINNKDNKDSDDILLFSGFYQ